MKIYLLFNPNEFVSAFGIYIYIDIHTYACIYAHIHYKIDMYIIYLYILRYVYS